MSNLYDLDDEALLNTNLEELHQEPEQATEATVEQPEQQEQTDGTDVPNETEEATESNTEQTGTDTGTTDEVTDTDTQTDTPVDYEAFYKEMTKPFKANGRELSIANADDAVRLMQMGANYSKKMEQLKPKQALLKVLEENHLDNQEKLGYLLDLANKKPEAIAKLIKDSEIDIYDFDTEEKSSSYVPDTKVRDQTKLEEVVNELSTSEGFSEVFNTISTEWDVASRQAIIDNPGLLKIIQAQKESGAYDRIVEAVAHERMLGRLTEVNYIDAYVAIEQGMFGTQKAVEDKPKKTFKASRPKAKPTNNSNKRKVASPSSSSNKSDDTFNPLEVSDEELLQIMEQNSKY